MNYEQFKDKYLLLDANILINYAKYARLLDRILRGFDDLNVTTVLDEMVRFEFLRYAVSSNETNALKNFLKTIFKLDDKEIDTPYSQPTTEIIHYATEIANIYAWRLKNQKISLVDCFLAARMRKLNETRPDRVYLASADSTDFPSLLFDRVGIDTVDLGENILNICFYRFNRDKFSSVYAEYKSQG
ncbi:MAG: hypothetical protein P4M11_11340 [Candidatus Pacebacteria bacterium]|nr:hypothetical protein [Candidatus Paceibacterota bacterium]